MLPTDSASKQCNTLYLSGQGVRKKDREFSCSLSFCCRGDSRIARLIFLTFLAGDHWALLQICFLWQVKPALWKAPFRVIFLHIFEKLHYLVGAEAVTDVRLPQKLRGNAGVVFFENGAFGG